jgi:hypothetical protein
MNFAVGADGEGIEATGINRSQHNNNAIDYAIDYGSVYMTFDCFS